MENVDMLHGALTKDLLRFTLPIALSSIVQQLFHAADTAVVGSFGDASALAAVGTNTEIVALIVTISSGLSVGANVLAASLVGQGEKPGYRRRFRRQCSLRCWWESLERAWDKRLQCRCCG